MQQETHMTLDPYDPPTPDTNGEPPPQPLPGEPDVPNDRMTPMFRAAVTPDAAASSVTAGPSSPAGEAPDGPGPAAALNPTFEAEVAGTARVVSASASNPPALGSTADMWMRFLGQHASTIQAAGGVL
jgi:hypothetical protein